MQGGMPDEFNFVFLEFVLKKEKGEINYCNLEFKKLEIFSAIKSSSPSRAK